jgi:ubiquinone/menaquinone biosynthesis C-methylase UbiE
MGVYDRYVLPHLIDLACGSGDVAKQRAKVVPRATGRVLEVGMGPGLNLPFYDRTKVELVWGLEPSEGMRRKAAGALAATDLDVRWLDLPGEEIPLDDRSVDTVVLTYTLCTIPDWERALEQVRRVLKPGGQLLFSEHGEAPDEPVRRWQHRIDPVWTRLAGGCHITRPIPRMIESAGFEFVDVESEYLPGPRIASYQSWGAAVSR